jgi:molybdenum cofactor sulfurtransferase
MSPQRQPLDSAFAEFLRRYPAYQQTAALDRLRATEYHRLDALDQVYLDYTGGGLYAERQVREHGELLRQHVFGNPHSRNPTSVAMSERVNRARARVLEYFNAASDEYVAIFTPNASGALRLVGESFPFQRGGRFVALADNHNSVNGVREFARARGAAVTYVPVIAPELRADRAALDAALALGGAESPRLLAYPAQSNFSGVKHPLDYVRLAHDRGWHVLLDAAAYVPTNRLDLSVWTPDFVSVSFYKMFGYPTGVGVLLARRSALALLERPWFAGGTIRIASVMAQKHYLADGEAAFEDGTVDYLSLPAVEIGLDHLTEIGIETIGRRVDCLTGWLLAELAALSHANGAPFVKIHGPTDMTDRGGTVTFNLYDPAGRPIPSSRVEELAAAARISVRTGCFCNPGAGEAAYQLGAEIMGEIFGRSEGLFFEELVSTLEARYGRNVSAIRASLGLAANFVDVHRLVGFLEQYLDKTVAEIGAAAPLSPAELHARDTA